MLPDRIKRISPMSSHIGMLHYLIFTAQQIPVKIREYLITL